MKTLFLNSERIPKTKTLTYIRVAKLTEVIFWVVICSILVGNQHSEAMLYPSSGLNCRVKEM
jgi:hypothetical protein